MSIRATGDPVATAPGTDCIILVDPICSRSLRNALPFNDRELTIDAWNVDGFNRAVGPPDLELVHTSRCTQAKVKRHIILRCITSTANHIPALADLAGRGVSRSADGIAR